MDKIHPETKRLRFKEEVNILNANKEYGINGHAENCMIRILNLIYDCNLKNGNYGEPNCPAIDLSDKEKRIAFQITSNASLEKVRHTIEKFKEYGLDKDYDKLYIYVIKDKQTHYSKEKIQKISKGIEFNSSYILDASDLYMKLNEDNDLNKIRRVCNYLEEQFGDKKQGVKCSKSCKVNRYKEYKKHWNKNLFLNDFDPEEENAGVNVTLSDMYILPNYTLKQEEKRLSTLEKRMTRVAAAEQDNRMLVILGQPGIGKSSLISWFLNACEKNLEKEVLVYRFTDFKDLDWHVTDVVEQLLTVLQMDISDLSNKILFLDGFDEILIKSNREDVLNTLYMTLIESDAIEGFSLFVTCREHYIEKLWELKCNYLTLQPLDEDQIDKYYQKYSSYTNMNQEKVFLEMLQENKEIFGIPIVLYMTLALNIEVKKETSVVDVYDRIFSLEKGIYDCANLKSGKHRIEDIKIKIQQLTRIFAVWIFQNNHAGESIPRTVYTEMMRKGIDGEGAEDVLIGNYFKIRHCEGEDAEELRFVHRTIYEYFVADAIFSAVKPELEKLDDESMENFARKIIPIIYKGVMTATIGEYLGYKIKKLYRYNKEKEAVFFDWLENVMVMLLKNKFYSYNNQAEMRFIELLVREMCCFSNFMLLLKNFSDMNRKQYIMEGKSVWQIGFYVKNAISNGISLFALYMDKFDLSEVKLERVDLSSANLQEAKLSGGNLKRANLSGANLYGTNLEGSDLRSAYLNGTTLIKANLREANLEEAFLYNTFLEEAHLEKAILIRAQIHNTNFEEAHMEEVNLIGVNLNRINLHGAHLSRAHLAIANLSFANLREADLEEAGLEEAYLEKADLRGANLKGAYLRGTRFKGASLHGTCIGCNNSGIKGLEKAHLSGARMYEDDCDEERREEFKRRGVIFEKRK